MQPTFKLAVVLLALPFGVSIASAAEAVDSPPTNAPTRAATSTELFGDPIIARGQGVEIKRSELEDAFTAWKANLAARGQSISEDQRTFRESQLLDKLLITKLMIHHATAGDKAVAKAQSEKFMADSKKDSATEEVFNGQLKALGLSPDQFGKRVMEQALAEAVLDRELKSKLAVNDAQVENFYKSGADALVKIMQEELERLVKEPTTTVTQLTAVKQQIEDLKKANLAKLEQPEKVHVIHLLIATRNRQTDEELSPEQKKLKRQQIEKLFARVKAGEDFSKLVLEFSEDRGLKETKGEYTLSRLDPFVPEFKAAAFTLNTNQISDIVTTMFGYHIIKCLEKIPARKADFAKVSPDIKEALLQQELQNQMPAYFERLKKEAAVEILEPKYKIQPPPMAPAAKPTGQ